ncbi:MAG TPA: hypothetical protein VH370_01960 [Humisphaera sp.]|nr:hypothetical protein [Humisphaera sp.]
MIAKTIKPVYLDQMHWISLAQAYYGIFKGKRARDVREVLDIALLKVQNGLATFPLSAVHIMEIAKAPDKDRRRRLARFVVELSRGTSILPQVAIVAKQILPAVQRLFSDCTPVDTVSVFGAGMNFAFGEHFIDDWDFRLRYPGSARLLSAIANSPEAMEYVLGDGDEAENRASIAGLRQQEFRMATRADTLRQKTQHYSRKERQTIYSALLLNDLSLDICRALSSLGRPQGDFFQLGERTLQLVDDIASLYVERELVIERDSQTTRPPKGNDMLDIAALSAAIPYCHIVVTEKMWTHISNVRLIGSRFGTTVTHDLMTVGSALATLEPAARAG